MTSSQYTFGDTGLAAERLEIVAATFAPTTRALIARAREHLTRARRVLDLGCGPGYTTSLLHDEFPDAAIVALDASERFAAQVRARVPHAQVVVGDALALDGHDHYDLVYARYLLAHLPDPEAAIEAWCRALAPGGVLLREEPEWIRSSDPDFARYEEISSALVLAAGGVFYAGPLIARAPVPAGIVGLVDEATVIDITAGQAAAMFWRNAAVWGEEAVAAGLTTPQEIEGLVTRLRAREGDATRGRFDWRQRQTALMRRA